MYDFIDRYITITTKIKQLEAERDILKGNVMSELMLTEDRTIQTPKGRVTLQNYTTWEYPEDVLDLEDQLKKKKLEARQYGTATEVVTPVIKFYEAKA